MIVAHVMGLPVEESVLQLAPAGAAMVTAVAIAGRTTLGRLRRRFYGIKVGDIFVIVRVFRARVHPGKEDEFERFVNDTGVPMVKAAKEAART